jgi:putative transposase
VRPGMNVQGLVHHSDAGSQYTSVAYSERLATHGIAPSVGSVGDSFDNAMAESAIGLYTTELIRRTDPGARPTRSRSPRSSTSTGSTSAGCHGEIGHVPPAEFEEVFYASRQGANPSLKVSTEPRAVHKTNK